MQKSTENGITILTADEGMKLTNDSTFASVVRLGKEDSGASWYEITEEEAEARQAEVIPTEDEATAKDYQAQLRRLGVDV
jgi:hypothetical protein